ncbi:FAD dependent oxidoreductase [Aspergillus sclerotialis]|uniref:FAD dependent oxidoreductase n=1 Tax=Aspergillus sclerotialis TaxID=2070753 RepID=A0A3A2Z6M6_9EURO|nr:FAD dependent oxidoreductase [Aspergillus sclerotialis]
MIHRALSGPLTAPLSSSVARSAYKNWADLEKRSGPELVNITGGIVFLPRGVPTVSSAFTKSLEANAVLYKLLDTKEVIDAVYTTDTGIVHADKSVTAMQY